MMLNEALVHKLEQEVYDKWNFLCEHGMLKSSAFKIDCTEYMEAGFYWDDITEILTDIGFEDDSFCENENIRYIYCYNVEG